MAAPKEKTMAQATAECVDAKAFKAVAHRSRDYSNLSPNVSGRPGLTTEDYYSHRPDERVPQTFKEIICVSDEIYQQVGLIWNIINLMTDFTVKGIKLVHPNKRKEKIYQQWFSKIGGPQISERFVNYLYRLGNIVLQRYTAKIKQENELVVSEADRIGFPKGYKPNKREIPWKYVFIHPATCENIGGPITAFANRPLYGVKLSSDIVRIIKSPKNDHEREVVSQLPADILKAANSQDQVYLLNSDRTIIYNYKKDDWAAWGNPIIRPILRDVMMLNKLKLADMCALDGAASKIRIIKLGDIANKLPATTAEAELLGGLLEANVGAGCADIIWGPAIDIIETTNDSYNFLGEEKYRPTLEAIYTGLGIPSALASASGGTSTNTYLSLNVLTERLEYGRSLLIDFWTKELAIFQTAMGYKQPAEIEFDQAILANEDVEKQLLIQLADRNLISDEALQSKFGLNSNLEKIRMNREERERKGSRRVKKAGQWFDPQIDDKMKMALVQQGAVTPNQVGLDLPPQDKQQVQDMLALQPKKSTDQESNPGQSGQGRPPGKKDTLKRQPKKFSPITKSSLLVWANSAQKTISEMLQPVILSRFDKKNLRQLTETEFNLAEKIKFTVLCGIKPFDEITSTNVMESLRSGIEYTGCAELLHQMCVDFTSLTNKSPTIEDIRILQSQVYLEFVDK